MIKTNLMATGIGSIPEADTDRAIGLVNKYMKDIPFWPQLPNRSAGENMILQYADCLPFVTTDGRDDRLRVNSAVDIGTELAALYENIENDRYDAFALNKKVAAGFYRFVDIFRNAQNKMPFIKGHVTGSLTLAVSINDLPENSDNTLKPIVHNETIMEMLPEAVGMMGAWQANVLSKIAERILIFLDEPALSNYGSEIHPVKQPPHKIKEIINKTVRRIKKTARAEKVYVGMHCCGDSTWEHWLDTDLDILNFDTFSHWDHFFNRKETIKKYIDSGKIIAFGLIPTGKEHCLNCTRENLWNQLKQHINSLVDSGIGEDRLIAQSMITPACGFGSGDVSTCEKGFELLMQVSDMARKEYGDVGI